MIKLKFFDQREIKEPGYYILKATGYLRIAYVNPADESYEPGFGYGTDGVNVAGPLCWDEEREAKKCR